MANAIPVGIDLGTTHSAVAWVDQSGRSTMIKNAEGDLLTPSVVLFNDNDVVVGREARTAITVAPDQVAEWVKRDMGAPVYHRPIRGEYLPPEVIQACILRKLRDDILGSIGSTGRAVITVPAYFDEPRRKATADAGEMAGLSVLDIVNEPVAAALAFGEVEGYLSASTGKPLVEMTVMVYDLGGGTFDVTLLKLAPGDIRTLATDGDVQLGGHDWDLRLLDHLAEQFKATHGLDPRDDRKAVKRLYSAAVEAKHTLSARRQAAVRFQHGGCSLEFDVSRGTFEDLTADLLERTAYTSRQLIAAAGLNWPQVDRILLVGGSTRMPMVSEMLQNLTGRTPDHTVNPDEAVARGAALYANYLLAKEAGPAPGFEVTNVNSHSLGIEGIDPATMRQTNVILIPRNTPLPATFSEKFTTKRAGQSSIVIQVLQGESSLPSECTAIGGTVVRGLPPDLPQGWPVEVTFEYATNGRLSVRAVVPGTHRETKLELERRVGLSQEGISGWKQTVASSAGFEAFGTMMRDPSSRAALSSNLTDSVAESPASESRWDAGPLLDSMAESRGASRDRQPAVVPPSDTPTRLASGSLAAGSEGIEPVPSPPKAQVPATEEIAPAAQPSAGGPAVPIRSSWAIHLIGFTLAAVFGLAAGYVLVCWLFPDAGFPRFW